MDFVFGLVRRFGWTVLGILLVVVGVPGTVDDLGSWSDWVDDVANANTLRWLSFAFGLIIIAFGNIPPLRRAVGPRIVRLMGGAEPVDDPLSRVSVPSIEHDGVAYRYGGEAYSGVGFTVLGPLCRDDSTELGYEDEDGGRWPHFDQHSEYIGPGAGQLYCPNCDKAFRPDKRKLIRDSIQEARMIIRPSL